MLNKWDVWVRALMLRFVRHFKHKPATILGPIMSLLTVFQALPTQLVQAINKEAKSKEATKSSNGCGKTGCAKNQATPRTTKIPRLEPCLSNCMYPCALDLQDRNLEKDRVLLPRTLGGPKPSSYVEPTGKSIEFTLSFVTSLHTNVSA